MAFILGIPIELRLALLFALGVIATGGLNWAIYQLAWNSRWISPWSAVPNDVTPRLFQDRLPIIGWWRLRREASTHGRGFWIRPLLLEISVGLSLAALYWWETISRGLLLPPQVGAVPPGAFVWDDWQAIVHMQFASHVVLFGLMLVASFIDIDEKIIPDTVTVPGTLAGLTLATLWPWSLLPGNCWLPPGAVVSLREFLFVSSPNGWPNGLLGAPNGWSLAIALACWFGWIAALMPRHWITRRGLVVAWKIFSRRLIRERFTWLMLAIGIVGAIAISLVWQFAADSTWSALLSSLVGLAASGGLIWIVRIIGSQVLGREAMGFGDVTLMAMVGTFIGWQAGLITFFVAPFAGLIIGLLQWILHRDNEIPYGPFLCLGSAAVIVFWVDVWEAVRPYFEQGWLVPIVIGMCMVLMAVLLGGWRLVRGLFGGER